MLNKLGQKIAAINIANGWDVCVPDDWEQSAHKVPAQIALIHSEASEALEGFRHNDKANFGEEMADILIRVLDVTTGLGIDIDAYVKAKLEKNKTRGFRHGGKRV